MEIRENIEIKEQTGQRKTQVWNFSKLEFSPKIQDNNLQVGILPKGWKQLFMVKIFYWYFCAENWSSLPSTFPSPLYVLQKMMCQLLWHSHYVTNLLGIVRPNISKSLIKSLGFNYYIINTFDERDLMFLTVWLEWKWRMFMLN